MRDTNDQDRNFSPTPWTMVLAAGMQGDERAQEALEALCKVYWPPIFAQMRMRGYDAHTAQDLTQEFFYRMLHTNSFTAATQEKGKFRTYLLASLRHFLINEWRKENTQKRGGRMEFIQLDALEQTVRDACEPADSIDPSLAFDRSWARIVIHKVRERLQREFEAAGYRDRYEVLKHYLVEDKTNTYQAAAKSLNMTDSATKTAIFRIRRRFGELLRYEISRTLADPQDLDDEIRHLLAALKEC